MEKELEKRNDVSEKDFKDQFSNKLKSIREQRSLTRNQASKLIGVSNSTLQAWEESGDRTPNSWDLIRISEVYEVNIAELFKSFQTDNTANINTLVDNAGNPVNLEEFTFIPRYDVSASAGHGCDICKENFMFSMSYRTYWIKNYLKVNPKALIAITARGDSMTGVIDDRDVMLVDTDNKTLSDGIYILRLDGDLLVKRAQKLPNQIIRISSANPVYEPFDIDMTNPPNDFEVIGAVVHTEPGTLFRYRKN